MYPVQHQSHPLHKAGLACSDEVRKQELMNSKSESSKRNNIICLSIKFRDSVDRYAYSSGNGFYFYRRVKVNNVQR